MSQGNVTITVFETQAAAETALSALVKEGFDSRQLSLVAVYHPDAAQESEFPWSVFPLSDARQAFVAGPLASWLMAVLENAAIFDELST